MRNNIFIGNLEMPLRNTIITTLTISENNLFKILNYFLTTNQGNALSTFQK